jgi:hypothetical protein
MITHCINSDSLGDLTVAAAERFALFCTEVSREAGVDIEFEVDYRVSGYSSVSAGNIISNICWDCDWYGVGSFRKSALNKAVSAVLCSEEVRYGC